MSGVLFEVRPDPRAGKLDAFTVGTSEDHGGRHPREKRLPAFLAVGVIELCDRLKANDRLTLLAPSVAAPLLLDHAAALQRDSTFRRSLAGVSCSSAANKSAKKV